MKRNVTRLAVLLGVAGLSFGVLGPAAAHHSDPNCTLTVHNPLGTDDLDLPAPLPEEGADIGFAKVFVSCQHGHGHGGGRS